MWFWLVRMGAPSSLVKCCLATIQSFCTSKSSKQKKGSGCRVVGDYPWAVKTWRKLLFCILQEGNKTTQGSFWLNFILKIEKHRQFLYRVVKEALSVMSALSLPHFRLRGTLHKTISNNRKLEQRRFWAKRVKAFSLLICLNNYKICSYYYSYLLL